jgi:tetratricopeptide (TPR) repeat protein
MTQEEFESSIDGDFEELRNELHVEQVTPVYDVRREALVRVRPGLEAQARALHEALSERVQGFLQLLTGSEHLREYSGLSPDALFLLIRHDSDRTYAGYGNIYRGLKTLAPCLEDARFFITELYDTFVDEYRVQDGVLGFSRGDCGEDSTEAIRLHWKTLLEQAPEDHDLRRFLARQHVYDGEYHAEKAGAATPEKSEREEEAREAMAAFDEAVTLDPGSARAWRQKAALHQLLGEYSQAAECFEQALSLGADPELLQPLALVSFSMRQEAKALAGLHRIPAQVRTRLTYQLMGHLHALAGEAAPAGDAFLTALGRTPATPGEGRLNPDAEALYRTGRAEEVLTAYFEHVTAKLDGGLPPSARALLVRDLVDWGEFFRIKMHHGFSPKSSRQLALDFYDRAISLGDSSGEAHYAKGLLHKLTNAPAQAMSLFAQAIGLNPEHLDARGKLGALALERGEHETALTHLRAYLELSSRAGKGSYYLQHYASLLMKALYDKANHLTDVARDFVASEATFDQIIDLGPHLPTALRNFEGAWVGKSNARAWRGDHEAALEFANRALELNPRSGYAWSAKGNALNNLRRFEEALPCHERAIAAEPGYWHPYLCKACTLALTGGDRQEIYALIRKTLSLSPERRAMLREEPDFISLRGDPAFLALFDPDAAPPRPPEAPRKKKTGRKGR